MRNRRKRIILLGLVLLSLPAAAAMAQLRADQVLVVANAASKESQALARTYIATRGIPEKNLVLIETTTESEISRAEFEAQIALPIRQALVQRELEEKIRCICLIYGVPLKVLAPTPVTGQAADAWRRVLVESHKRLAAGTEQLEKLATLLEDLSPADVAKLRALLDDPQELVGKLPSIDTLKEQIPRLAHKALAAAGEVSPATLRELARAGVHRAIDHLLGQKGLAARMTGASRETRLAAIEKLASLEPRILELRQARSSEPTARKLSALLLEARGLAGAYAFALEVLSADESDLSEASVDSELSLLWVEDYELSRWLPNPLHWRHEREAQEGLPPALMTARLDAPSATDAEKMLTASVETEKVGLKGKVYIDAGGVPRARSYDDNLVELSRLLQRSSVSVRLDKQRAVLPRNSAPDAALYVGWYSLGKYVPAFLWNKGAVGWHISSSEAATLRDPNSQAWCVKMIQNGVAATLGAVDEPYLAAFPLPQEFFPLLLTGKLTIAECYWRTAPHTSWRMTLIGDPLYNPYKASPALRPGDLPRGLLP
jgi:uncharacterized protein (TIGR03790 family)